MTDEQFEKRMQFMLDQQAQFAGDIQKLEASQAKTDERIRALVDVSLSLTGHVEEIDRRLAAFINETNSRFQVTDDRIRILVESGTHTDQRLDALIDIVQRQMERGNGKQASQ